MAQPSPTHAAQHAGKVMKDARPQPVDHQPDSGIVHVSKAMKSVKPHWTSDNFQSVAAMIGWTKRVQAYCRFPIMIIATTAAAQTEPTVHICSLLAARVPRSLVHA